MKRAGVFAACLGALGAALYAPAYAAVSITSFTPSVPPPQVLGTPVTWTVTATDSNPGPLTFRFNVGGPGQAAVLARDYNVGTLNSGTWTSPAFVWTPTAVEGLYPIQVLIKDFTSGDTASQTVSYTVNPLVTGNMPVVVATANPLVALFSAPSCPIGSKMRVNFQPASKIVPVTRTSYARCQPPSTMTFEIAGMYPNTKYYMSSETRYGGNNIDGPTVTFTTATIPVNVPIPPFTVDIPSSSKTDTGDSVLLQNLLQFDAIPVYPAVATDLSGNIIWYYFPNQSFFLTRPLGDGTMLTLEDGPAWSPLTTTLQFLRQIDLAGNIVHETNIGALSAQLVAMGASDAQMCNTITSPAVGSTCMGTFHHDAIQTLPNGGTAVLADIEKIFPAGTQGDTTGLPVDIIGDIIIVLDGNWNVVWYFDSFQHAGGAPQLDINRPAVLGETCLSFTPGCPPLFLLGAGIASHAHDWLHANALYYSPLGRDILFSTRHQDWVMKVDFQNARGTGDILWRLGPCGDFTFNNLNNDPWPWFSHQHDFGLENHGAGPATVFDNGNTRYSPPGRSTGCMSGLGTGSSRGMAFVIDERTLQVTPVLSVNMGVQSFADGSAQLLSDGNYFFLASDVFYPGTVSFVSYNDEILPTAGTLTGTQVLNIQAPQNYRAWRMQSLYTPPTT